MDKIDFMTALDKAKIAFNSDDFIETAAILDRISEGLREQSSRQILYPNKRDVSMFHKKQAE